jgi:iron complex outermembrane recepter protein
MCRASAFEISITARRLADVGKRLARYAAATILILLVQAQARGGEPADFESPAAGGPGILEDVVVTARRRPENAQDVPIPMTALPGSSLEQTGTVRLDALNQQMPSLNIELANPRQVSIAVRGLGNNPANDGLESSVAVYLDDVYLGRPGMASQDLVDIEQISLLRGPQATLFGKNTTAGVLDIATRPPSATPYAMLETSVGNYGYYQVRGTASGPLDESLAGRISFSKDSRDGYTQDVTDNTRVNGTARQSVRGQLLFRPNDALSVRAIADYETENSNCCTLVLYNEGLDGGVLYKTRLAAAGATQLYDPTFSSVTINDLPHVAVRQGGGSVKGTLSLVDGYTLTSISAYRAWHFVPRYDGDNTSASAIIDLGQSVDDEQWSQEFRLAPPAGGPLDWVAGTYYFYQYQDNLLNTQYGPAASAFYGLPVFYNDSQSIVHTYPKTSSYAAFAQDVWHATSALSVTTGVRDTYEEKTSHIWRGPATSALLHDALPSYDSGPLRLADNDVSGAFNLDYAFDANAHGYLIVARGAKAGGINEAVPTPGLRNSSLYVLPETAIDYELGVKSKPLAQRLMFNVALFWTDVKNYQATLIEQPLPGVFAQTLANIGSIRTRGIETEMSSKLPEWLTLRLTASYNEAVYTSYFNAPCAAESVGELTCNLTGHQVVGAPKWIANPSISPTDKISSDLDAYALAEYSWRSSFFGTPDDSEFARVNAYGLVNLRAGLRGNGGRSAWDFSLWADNVLDKHYIVGGVSGVSGPTFGAYWLVPGTPRFWGATIRLEF